jgi:hypothetical protein
MVGLYQFLSVAVVGLAAGTSVGALVDRCGHFSIDLDCSQLEGGNRANYSPRRLFHPARASGWWWC